MMSSVATCGSCVRISKLHKNNIKCSTSKAHLSTSASVSNGNKVKSKMPDHFWDSKQNQKMFLQKCAKTLGINNMEDWYSVSPEKIVELGGRTLIKEHYTNLGQALTQVFPDYPWEPWRFQRVSVGWWKDLDNQRSFVRSLAKKYNIKNIDSEEWYKLSEEELHSIRLESIPLLSQYNYSLSKTINTLFPSANLLEWKFKAISKYYWSSLEHQKLFVDWVAQQLGIKSHQDWFDKTAADVQAFNDHKLLQRYHNTLFHLLTAVYPDFPQEPWRFTSKTPQHFFANMENQRKYFEGVAKELGITNYEGWYSVKIKDIQKIGGWNFIARHYDGSFVKAITSVFPEYDWKVWRFSKVPAQYWEDENHAMQYINWLAEQFEIKRMDDWLQISKQQIELAHGKSLLIKFGGDMNAVVDANSIAGLIPMLSHYFPEFKWAERQKRGLLMKTQQQLHKYVQLVFSPLEVLSNFNHPELHYASTNREMGFDIFIKELNLAIEYQGDHHYQWSPRFGSPEVQQLRDEEKREACKRAGITLIEVPYWWDRTLDSVVATLKSRGVSLPPKYANMRLRSGPIPDSPPKNLKLKTPLKDQVYMARPLKWKGDPTGWITIPCFGGVPVLWNGEGSIYLKKTMQEIEVPESFTKGWPDIALEGELWSSEGVDPCLKVLENPSAPWSSIVFRAHDAPLVPGPTKDRLEKANSILQPLDSATIAPIQYSVCADSEHLQKTLGTSGYGVLLKQPAAMYYESGCHYLAKVANKEQARFVKEANGFLHCQLYGTFRLVFTIFRPNDKPVSVEGPADFKAEVGAVVEIAHQGVDPATGELIEPKFLRVRPDLSWLDSLQNPLPFRVALSHKLGVVPRCRGCFKPIPQRDTPRLEVRAAFTPMESKTPHPAKLFLCLDTACIEKAATRYSNKRTGVFFPKFDGKIGVPMGLQEAVKPQMSQLAVEWIVL